MFDGANRPGASASQGMPDQFWLWSMEGGLKNAFASIKAFSETDFKARRKFTIRVDLMVSELPNQDEINADLLEF
jgi:non-heme chloroperoxidase